MKTLIQKTTTGLMICGILTIVTAGALQVGNEAFSGAALLIIAGTLKSIIS